MHPELYMVVHRQRERELEAELRRRLLIAERTGTMPPARRRSRGGPPFGAWFAVRRAATPELSPEGPCVTA